MKRHLRIFSIAVISFLIISSAFLSWWKIHYSDKFLPGISFAGVSLAGERYEDVFMRVDRVGKSLEKDGIHIVVESKEGEKTIVVPSNSVGFTPDVVVSYFALSNYELALKSAFDYGRRGGFWESLVAQAQLAFRGEDFSYGMMIYPDSIKSLLSREVKDQLPQPQNASFSRNENIISITEEKNGETINETAVIEALQSALRRMETNRVMVRAEVSKPKVTKEHLLPILPFAKALTGIKPIRLIYADGKVVRAGGARVASWMTVDQSKTGLSFGISDEPLKLFIEKYINNDLPDSPRNSRFKMVDGQLQEIAPGLIGTVVDINDLKTQLVAFLHLQYSAFSSGSFNPAVDDAKEILVSFKQEYPKVTSDTIKRFHITDLIGRSETSFKGSSASRVKNISLGIERISGTILAPGDEFSLVKAIGEVTEETGYDKEYVIKGDRSIKEAGGGLCQVATTAFRGVLDAGLPVTERQNHSYVVGYYGPGLDATIYGPHPDLKFVNDTKDYMLFQMRVEGTKVITELYGKKDNRSVTTSAPILFDYIDPPPPKYIPDLEKAWGEMECHDQPRKGLTTQATTTVTYADGKVRTQVFDSVYQPWPKICIVGIKR